MTTSRVLGLLGLGFALAGSLGAQTPAATATPATTAAQPATTATAVQAGWAVGRLAGTSSWADRLPLMVARAWGTPATHTLSDEEKSALKQTALDQALATALKAASAAKLALARKQLAGTATEADRTSTQKTVADAEAKAADAQAGRTTGVDAPATMTLAFRASGDGFPWPVGQGKPAWTKANAVWYLGGRIDEVGPALSVKFQLENAWLGAVVATWEATFDPSEADRQMAAAAAALLPTLTGASPNQPVAPAEVPAPATDTLVLETDPPGVPLYLDSRYLGPSPQMVPRPGATTRVRGEPADGASQSWEIGPSSPSTVTHTMLPKTEVPDVPAFKDRFYWILAGFSASLTSTAFASAWSAEQVKLTNAYADAGDTAGYHTAHDRYLAVTALYGTGVVLTSALFVWMMVELGDYLTAAQASLP